MTDAKVKDIKFTPGQWVWRFYPRRYSNRSPKWSRPYDGPYLITKIIEPCDYVIQRSKRGVPQVVHGDKLKLCHSDVPPSWVPATTTDPVDDTDDLQQIDHQNNHCQLATRMMELNSSQILLGINGVVRDVGPSMIG